MSKGATNEELMGLIHTMTAQQILAGLEGTSYVDPDTGKEVKVPPDPRMIQVAVTFLNNNKCVMNPHVDIGQMSEIESKLADKKRRFAVVASEAREDAEREAGLG